MKMYLTEEEQQEQYAYLHNLRSALRRIYREAKQNGSPQREILNRRDSLFSGDSWTGLTDVDRSRMFGYSEALSDEIMDGLTHLYKINDKWYTAAQVIDRVDGTEPGRDCSTNNLHYCYKMSDGTIRIFI